MANISMVTAILARLVAGAEAESSLMNETSVVDYIRRMTMKKVVVSTDMTLDGGREDPQNWKGQFCNDELGKYVHRVGTWEADA